MVQEISVQTSGISAESNADGSVVNMIPKEGGNSSPADVRASTPTTASRRQPDRRAARARPDDRQQDSEDVRRRRHLRRTDQEGQAVVLRALREWGNRNLMAGKFWNKTQGTPLYTPDLSRPADATSGRVQGRSRDVAGVRGTSSTSSPTSRTTASAGDRAVGSAPEAGLAFHFRPRPVPGDWTAPVTNRLLLEAGASRTISHWPDVPKPGVEPTDISILELSTNFRYNARRPTATKSSDRLRRSASPSRT